MLYSPQIRCSDDSDAIERLTIQMGTAVGYPVGTMGAMSGTFGYELDTARLSEEERRQVCAWNERYHRFCDLIYRGRYHRDRWTGGLSRLGIFERGWQSGAGEPGSAPRSRQHPWHPHSSEGIERRSALSPGGAGDRRVRNAGRDVPWPNGFDGARLHRRKLDGRGLYAASHAGRRSGRSDVV